MIAVTVGGGMIDFCLKILNAEKAQHFLQDPANLPRLIAAKSVALSTYSYLATANHDPDGESDGTTIAVLKP